MCIEEEAKAGEEETKDDDNGVNGSHEDEATMPDYLDAPLASVRLSESNAADDEQHHDSIDDDAQLVSTQ